MARSNLRRALSLAILIVLAPLATAAGEGFYYEATTIDQSEKGKERSRMLVRGWVDGGGAKIEFVDQKGTMFGEGTYLLTENGGETLYLVNPKEKAYSKWDMEEMFATMGALLESTGPLLDLEFSNASSQKLGEEDGGGLLGYPTRRYKWQSAYDMRMSIMGMKRQYHIDMLQDFWVTDRLNDEGFKVWLRPDRMKTGSKQFDELLTSDLGRINGFPLKSVTHTTMTTG
ncbi:MAG TPA: hypothetical protein VMS86_06525, partial [Thermoanaerobaculia bacterium]|nr:hypothetical protein [Thermoanaerobaculia bacterium]